VQIEFLRAMSHTIAAMRGLWRLGAGRVGGDQIFVGLSEGRTFDSNGGSARFEREGPPASSPAGPGTAPADLERVRGEIDAVDREIVRLLARRTTLAQRAGRAKAVLRAPVLDASREADVFATRRDWANENQLNAEAVVSVFRAIVAMARIAQQS